MKPICNERYTDPEPKLRDQLDAWLKWKSEQIFGHSRGVSGRERMSGQVDRNTRLWVCCCRCGRWGTRQFIESHRSDRYGRWECSNDRACARRLRSFERQKVS